MDWEATNRAEFEQNRASIDALILEISELSRPVTYPAACNVSPILESACDLNKRLLLKLPQKALRDIHLDQIEKIQSFVQNAQHIRQQAISDFEERQLVEWSDYFETFESNRLTPEQRKSNVADEDATLVLAGGDVRHNITN